MNSKTAAAIVASALLSLIVIECLTEFTHRPKAPEGSRTTLAIRDWRPR